MSVITANILLHFSVRMIPKMIPTFYKHYIFL
nr:MAG TPA: hypothetical protein [Caudoviricetes sp.]